MYFMSAMCRLVWLDDGDGEVAAETLAAANPLDVLTVDIVRAAPPAACAVRLLVRDTEGQPIASLDRCRLGEE